MDLLRLPSISFDTSFYLYDFKILQISFDPHFIGLARVGCCYFEQYESFTVVSLPTPSILPYHWIYQRLVMTWNSVYILSLSALVFIMKTCVCLAGSTYNCSCSLVFLCVLHLGLNLLNMLKQDPNTRYDHKANTVLCIYYQALIISLLIVYWVNIFPGLAEQLRSQIKLNDIWVKLSWNFFSKYNFKMLHKNLNIMVYSIITLSHKNLINYFMWTLN